MTDVLYLRHDNLKDYFKEQQVQYDPTEMHCRLVAYKDHAEFAVNEIHTAGSSMDEAITKGVAQYKLILLGINDTIKELFNEHEA